MVKWAPMSERSLSTAQVAERIGVSERTVRLWCKQGKFPNAHTKETPFGDYWIIPESDLNGFERPQPGRPSKQAGSTEKAATGRANANGGTPTKRAAKKRGKK
jgi:hypothetical protein